MNTTFFFNSIDVVPFGLVDYLVVWYLVLFLAAFTKSHELYFLISTQTFWTLSYFTPLLYGLTVFSILLLVVPTLPTFLATSVNRYDRTALLYGRETITFALFPLLLIALLVWTWTGSAVTLWFNHLLFSSFHPKLTLLLGASFSLSLLTVYLHVSLTSQEPYDYLATCYNLFFWLHSMFLVNNLFTLIFFLEILATLISLLLITSTFSTLSFYNNLNLQHHSYFQNSLPFTFLQTLLTYFWISLVTALNLFLFLLLLYLRWFTFEWSLLETLFSYTLINGSFKGVFVGSLIWANFLGAFFLKGGIVPFFLWKPTFFKGLPLPTLFFYVTVYYFWLLLFFFVFLSTYVHDLFYFYSFVVLLFLIIGAGTLVSFIFESFYIKSFFAVSSTLNTILTLLALSAGSTCDGILLF